MDVCFGDDVCIYVSVYLCVPMHMCASLFMSVRGEGCYSLDLECFIKTHVLKAWSQADGVIGRWWKI